MKLYSFQAVWCRPCASLKPKLAKEAEKYNVTITAVDIELHENKSLVEKYRVHSVPTVVLVEMAADSEVEVDRFAGDVSRQQLENFFKDNTGVMQDLERKGILPEVF